MGSGCTDFSPETQRADRGDYLYMEEERQFF